ncbi:MAG TPA: type II secretion system F family protein [Chthonomonadales bacterium]|nr:type II secretion system F family protein [Chthonomonadales bacterium]
MALYRYEAVDSKGKTVHGVMDDANEAAVVDRLTRLGYRCAIVRGPSGARPSVGSSLPKAARPVGSRPSAQHMAVTFRQLASLVRAGIPLHEACQSLVQHGAHPTVRVAAQAMATRASAGGRVSDAMEEWPWLFPPHIVGGVRAGEMGGFADAMLDEIAQGYEDEVALFRGALLTRVVLWQGAIGLAMVQPVFPALMPDADLRAYLLAAFGRNLPILLGVWLAWRWWFRRGQMGRGRALIDRWQLRVPLLGGLTVRRSLSVFVRTVRRLYAAGLDAETVWTGALAVVPNAAVRRSLGGANALAARHAPLHEVFAATGLFSPEVIGLVASGHQAGALPEMLDRVSALQQGEVEAAFSAARYWMLRTAIAGGLLLSGLAVAFLIRGYFDAVFRFTEGWVP